MVSSGRRASPRRSSEFVTNTGNTFLLQKTHSISLTFSSFPFECIVIKQIGTGLSCMRLAFTISLTFTDIPLYPGIVLVDPNGGIKLI